MKRLLCYIGFFTIAVLFVFAAHAPVFQVSTVHAQDLTPEQRAQLQTEYDQLQAEIAQWQKVLDDTKAKKNTLTGDVTSLTAQINKAQAQIDQRNITIKTLGSEITKKTATIQTLEQKIEAGHDSLSKLIREKNEAESTPLAMVALSSETLSSFFDDVQSIDTIDQQLQDLFNQLRGVKTETQNEKDALAAKQSAQVDARYKVELTQQQINADKQQKKQLLAITTNQETQYQKVLAANQAKAAAIRAALFPLRDAAAIEFGAALQFAQVAQKSTGVDPALVLAILTQESNLGANVGQCYLKDETTGAGVGKNSGKAFAKVMSPTRDVPPFLALADKLGFDPHGQVVSCPIASAGGWGGAMGPAQFIPSTWALYAKRIAAADGVSTANPWNPQDAITAMSVYLGDLGADKGGYTAESTAAAKYYAGGAWATAGKTYASQVMSRVAAIQQNIDFLNDL
ncbi:MAG: lytic murein transglycosylase [Candidatus Adlerbacteria bacterium]|nr:lytic murein transglycosylase [Candidatus Adlerbacteria bacterium]